MCVSAVATAVVKHLKQQPEPEHIEGNDVFRLQLTELL